MFNVWRTIGLAILLMSLPACSRLASVLPTPASQVPPSRLEQYLGKQAVGEPDSTLVLPEMPIRAGLVLVPDSTAPGAAPLLGDEALAQMAEALREKIGDGLRMHIDRLIPADGVRPDGEVAQFVRLGKRENVEYLVVAVVSSTEQEYPITVFLGWTTHAQPGLRRDNWSLVEVALVDVKTGDIVLHAEGRGWATLDRPTAAGINQWYPVIWKRPQEPNWRWWPPTYESAPHTLRVIAVQDAVKRLVLNLQDAWIQRRQEELDRAG